MLFEFEPIAYFGCGGKLGVFKVFTHMKNRGKADGILFMVDRDHERPPFSNPEILRTEAYSWESHACHGEVIATLVQRKASPALGNAEREAVRQRWDQSLDSFREILATVAALLELRHTAGSSVGLGAIRFTTENFEVGQIRPAESDTEIVIQKYEDACLSEEEENLAAELKEKFLALDVWRFAHGKILFGIVRKFIPICLQGMAERSLPVINSAKLVASSQPHSAAHFAYIRDYAATRLAA